MAQFSAPPKTWTLAELQDFSPVTIDGIEYGVNKRGDVVNDDCEFIGHYAKKKLNKDAPKPENWDEIVATEEDDE